MGLLTEDAHYLRRRNVWESRGAGIWTAAASGVVTNDTPKIPKSASTHSHNNLKVVSYHWEHTQDTLVSLNSQQLKQLKSLSQTRWPDTPPDGDLGLALSKL